MQRSVNKPIIIEYSFYVFAAVFLLLVPLRLALAWTLAVLIHEFSHYLFLRLYNVSIISTTISATGMKMETGLLTGRQELVCALAGPFGGIIATAFYRWIPCTAICAFVHSIFNLIPMYPLDGGRALRCILHRLFEYPLAEQVSKWTGYVLTFMLAVSAIIISFVFKLGIYPIGIVGLFLVKIKLANSGNK